MCLLALFYRVVEDAPVVIGANEDYFAEQDLIAQWLADECRCDPGATFAEADRNVPVAPRTTAEEDFVPIFDIPSAFSVG